MEDGVQIISLNRIRLAPWYAVSFASELVPIYPLYAVMFGEFGVSPFQLAVLLAVWATWAMAMEVPSGAWADKYSRRLILAVAGLLKSVAFLIWIFAPHFWGFLAGFLAWGTAGALGSGTHESLLFDTLREGGQTGQYTRIFGRLRALGTMSGALAMFAGGFLIRYGYSTVLVFSAAFPMLSGVMAALGLRDAPRSAGASSESAATEQRFLPILLSGVREVRTSPSLLFIIAVSISLFTLSEALDEFIGPALREKSFSREAVGYLFGLIFLCKACGSALAHRLHEKPRAVPYLVMLVAGGGLAAAGFGRGWIVPAGFALMLGLAEVGATLFAARLQHSIRGRSRATITSLQRFVGMITGTILLLAFGAAANRHGMQGGVLLFAAMALVLSLFFLLLDRSVAVGPNNRKSRP